MRHEVGKIAKKDTEMVLTLIYGPKINKNRIKKGLNNNEKYIINTLPGIPIIRYAPF